MSGGLGDMAMARDVVARLPRMTVVAVDTIAHLTPEDAGRIVMTGSHGGLSSGEYAAQVRVAAVFFNDAGIGKDAAGVAALAALQAKGIAAGAVSSDSAAIGEALETWASGVVSTLNTSAVALGFAMGEPIRDAVHRLYGEPA